MSENEQGTFKPQFGAELNIESIIGAPLVAASKANVMMLTGQAQFLLDYCFTKEEGSNLRQPLMIEMVLSQPVVDHTETTHCSRIHLYQQNGFSGSFTVLIAFKFSCNR